MPRTKPAPRARLEIPEPRPDQWEILNHPARYKVVNCGRQFGKNVLSGIAALIGHGPRQPDGLPLRRGALQGAELFWIAKDYPSALNIWEWLKRHAGPVAVEKKEDEKRMVFPGGGSLTIRSAERPDSCRGFTLDGVIWDECAFAEGKRDRDGKLSETGGGYYFFNDVLRPALTVKQGWVIFISTPAPELNWFYDWFQQAVPAADFPDERGWARWQKASSENPLITPEELAEARLNGVGSFEREYLAQFPTETGAMFHPEWLEIKPWTEYPKLLAVAHFVDSAFKEQVRHDYSALTTWGVGVDRHFYLLDGFHDRLDYPTLQVRVHRHYQTWHKIFSQSVVVVEGKASGQSLVQTLRAGFRTLNGDFYRPIPAVEMQWPKGMGGASKVARAEAATGLFEGGLVHLPAAKSAWKEEFVKQLAQFPGGRHDDYVDCVSQAAQYLRKYMQRRSMQKRQLKVVRVA